MGNTYWSAENEGRLAKLVAEGYSGGQIGNMMGFTRCAILGKVARLGLKMAREPTSTIGIFRAMPKRRSRARTRAAPVAPVADTLPVTVEQLPEARVDDLPDDCSRLHLSPGEAVMLLEVNDCRWPIGTVGEPSFHFCGRPRQDGYYCLAHAEKARSKESKKGTGRYYDWVR